MFEIGQSLGSAPWPKTPSTSDQHTGNRLTIEVDGKFCLNVLEALYGFSIFLLKFENHSTALPWILSHNYSSTLVSTTIADILSPRKPFPPCIFLLYDVCFCHEKYIFSIFSIIIFLGGFRQ